MNTILSKELAEKIYQERISLFNKIKDIVSPWLSEKIKNKLEQEKDSLIETFDNTEQRIQSNNLTIKKEETKNKKEDLDENYFTKKSLNI
ncbi:MAG: hypothetical protein K9L98_01910 [Candidatus Pacebacteria bacterium]|nr:hypothetical protein [Candidatus Paceibacterota bacterium]MCF7862743.1 hypothetical protein [Candidatus Paceibacterota bacterium]